MMMMMNYLDCRSIYKMAMATSETEGDILVNLGL